MKAFLVFLGLIAIVQLSYAVFSEFQFGDKNSKFFKREPPLRATKTAKAVDAVYEGWIKQRMDNFDPQNTESFYMRYMFNFENFKPDGPIFIFVGGEWTISPGMLQFGHMYDMAKALNGLLIYTEHRYYGDTRPTPNLTLEELRYLNIDQALADLAHFIVSIKERFPGAENSGVILVGCSYSGTMVTWFMQKYPHLIKGAWALSGPLLAQVDFIEYQEVVSKAVHQVGGENCSSTIRNAFEEMEALAEQGNAAELERLFKLCKPLDLTNDLDVWSLFGDAAGTWSGAVQYYHRDDRDIEKLCEGLEAHKSNTTSDLEAYAQWILNRWRINPCYDHTYDYFLERWNGTSWDDWIARSEWRQWYYQTCAEYGWYQSSGSDEILFGNNFPVNISVQICSDLYNGFFTPNSIQGNIDRTNVIYGAKNPSVRNVYSTHGEYDPWAPMGLEASENEDSPVVYLPGESHCSDLSSIHTRDTLQMVASKNRIFSLVQKWLGIPEADHIQLPQPT